MVIYKEALLVIIFVITLSAWIGYEMMHKRSTEQPEKTKELPKTTSGDQIRDFLVAY